MTSSAGCTQRQYLTSGALAQAQQIDPQLQMIRVYPSTKFVVVYNRAVGKDAVVDSGAGGIAEVETGEQRLYPIGRKTPGAILAVENYEGSPLLWVTFRQDCGQPDCAYGFVQTTDGLFRLVKVPELKNYSEPEVYRKRITERKLMRKTKTFSQSRTVPVYVSTRGIIATIALEIPRQKKVDTTVVVVPTEGVPTRTPVPSNQPPAGPVPSSTPSGDAPPVEPSAAAPPG